MNQFAGHTDAELFSLVKQHDVDAFDELYDRYWEKLFSYVYNRTRSKDVTFEIVQDVFVSLWSRKVVIELKTSLSGYLFASVRFQIINYIRSSKRRGEYLQDYARFAASITNNSNEDFVMLDDLQKSLERSIDQLPERCREISKLSMLHHWPVDKISSQLRISERTVENQLAFARKHLRVSLADYMALCLVLTSCLPGVH